VKLEENLNPFRKKYEKLEYKSKVQKKQNVLIFFQVNYISNNYLAN
jgi:hypothetical protein